MQVFLGGIREQTTEADQQSKVGQDVANTAISTSSKAPVMSDKTKPVSSTSFTATSATKSDASTELLDSVSADLLGHPDNGAASVNDVLQLEQQPGVSDICQVRLHREIISLATHFLLTDQQLKLPHPVSLAQEKGH